MDNKTVKEALKDLIKEKKTTQTDLARKTGNKNQSNIAMFIKGSDKIQVNNFLQLLEGLGQDLVIIDRATGTGCKIIPDQINNFFSE